MPVRKANAHWKGDLKEGEGAIDFGGKRFPYSFESRFEEGEGFNPEELIGGALSGCFAMALSLELTKAGFDVRHIDASARVYLEESRGGFAIERIDLECEGNVRDIEWNEFDKYAKRAKENCPVGKALSNVEITLSSKLG